MANINRGRQTYERLIDEGWHFDHSALCSSYRGAGTVSEMQTCGGFDYCRVHYGRVVKGRYQVTDVMRRAVQSAEVVG